MTDKLKEHVEHCSPAELVDAFNRVFDVDVDMDDVEYESEN